ncbi:MAG: phosphoprotein phosphatase [Polyangiaceae bacterium]|nr:phosphoprotein phosphatase [Polyangiaceae bacterium]
MGGRILPRFDFRVDIEHASVTGKVRAKNEDNLTIAPELSLFGVADGMGGLSDGEVASRLALDVAKERISAKPAQRAIEAYVQSPTLERRREVFAQLRDACEAAHARLTEEQERRKTMMGTTLDLCLLARDKAFVVHVGDGRVYLVRPRATLQLTEDHLARDPASARAGGSARRTPRPLVSGVGLPSPLRADVFVVDLRRGDTVVLATDGAYAPLGDEAAVTSACRGAPRAIVDHVIRQSLAKGGRDNASLIVLRIEERLVARATDTTPAKPGKPNEHAEQDDMLTVQHCPIFVGLTASNVLAALSAGIEIEVPSGQELPRFEAGDLCAYIILGGMVKVGSTTLGAPGLVFAESLVGVERNVAAIVSDDVRCLRIRRDDFREVAEHDPVLGLALYQRLAGHLARAH